MVRFTLDYLRAVFGAFGDAQVRPYLVAAGGLIVLGTAVYVQVEGWSILDAAYFCVVALATIGFGDFAPTTTFGKLFTMAYIVVGLGILGTFFANLARISMQRAQILEQEQQTRSINRREHAPVLKRGTAPMSTREGNDE